MVSLVALGISVLFLIFAVHHPRSKCIINACYEDKRDDRSLKQQIFHQGNCHLMRSEGRDQFGEWLAVNPQKRQPQSRSGQIKGGRTNSQPLMSFSLLMVSLCLPPATIIVYSIVFCLRRFYRPKSEKLEEIYWECFFANFHNQEIAFAISFAFSLP